MSVGKIILGATAVLLGVRVVRSRHRRFLHPDGRSFTGELDVWGLAQPIGSRLADHPGRHPVTVRISKGVGTSPGRPDVLGLAVRVEGHGDLLLSTAGRGRVTQRLPVPRRTFDTGYGTILAYRTGSRDKVYLRAEPDLDGTPLGNTLESVATAARQDMARLLLGATDGGGAVRLFGRISFGAALPADADAALAFDPIRNAPDDLHPTGLIHGLRAAAYPLSQRWRGARPAPPHPGKVARTAAHR